MFRKSFLTKNKFRRALFTAGVCLLSLSQSLTALASVKEDNIARHQAMPIESNEVENWPTGPVVSAEAAILMEADTGTILYAKNIHKQEFPASTTKILTTLIASERCSLDELVSFSHDAVFDIDRGSNHIAIDEGEKLTMEQCLNAILIRSANEVSLAVAEHISGGHWTEFAAIMNERAKELGCLNSNFVNPNGLPHEEHLTTAYDLATIGRAFFDNEALCKITLTPLLQIPASEYQPQDIVEANKMELIPTGRYAYEYLVGCKTGYTNDARSTLVSCAEKDGMKLICVVLRDESPHQYEDTIALFDYGFSNFEKVNVSQTETKYNIDNTGSFYTDNDIFGSSKPILSLNREDCVILPKTVSFDDLESTITYDTDNPREVAQISYTYHGVSIGSASVDLAVSSEESYTFDSAVPEQAVPTPSTVPEATSDEEEVTDESKEEPTFIFVNIVKVFAVLAGIALIAVIALLAKVFFKNYQFSTKLDFSRRRRQKPISFSMISSRFRTDRAERFRQNRRRKKSKRPNRFRDYDF